MDENYSFLGTGWGFPPKFSDNGGKIDMVSGSKDVEQSLKIILTTLVGERVMRPEFGCDLTALSFRNISESILYSAQDTVRKAVDLYEPRVQLENVTITPKEDEGKVLINLEYTILESNARYNMIYPYYLYESQVLDF